METVQTAVDDKKHVRIAQENLLRLADNPYPGRGLVVGLSADSTHLVQVYWIMGRSTDSRNRTFVLDELGTVRTEAINPAAVKNPELTLYPVMMEESGCFILSNGAQTPDALRASKYNEGLANTHFATKHIYEPDAPNNTPRITAFSRFEKSEGTGYCAEIALMKKSPFGETCDFELHRYHEFFPGTGYCVTTYTGDGKPLPSFVGSPYLLPLSGTTDVLAHVIWGALNEDNRVSLAVKMISFETRKSEVQIINKYKGR